ncbi:MAG TPA: hypothetical protein VNJ08_01040 [Bacteriovoracaceae bacterium]|nr:hypothetical protein [Bacteriovoracaceae bacterium]
MKKLLVLSMFVFVASASAADNTRHIISMGSDGFGWSGVGEQFKWDKSKNTSDNVEESEGSLELNYLYLMRNRMMVGGEISYATEKIVVKDVNDDIIKSEEDKASIGLSVGYNFADNLMESWWIKGTLARVTQENKLKRTAMSPVRNDVSGNALKFALGKRFNLANFNLLNIAYAPSIELSSVKYGSSADDMGLDSSTEVTINFIKFDLLF